jgi:hypothetical protein
MPTTTVRRTVPAVKLIYDSAGTGCDLPRPFAAGLDPDLDAELDAALSPKSDPFLDLLKSLQYPFNNASAIASWADQRGGRLDRCPLVEPADLALLEDAWRRSKAPAPSTEAPAAEFEPTPEERGWAAMTSPFEPGGWGRRLGLVPSRVKANRRTRQYSR